MLDQDEADALLEQSLAEHARHSGTRVIPVFVMSLTVRGGGWACRMRLAGATRVQLASNLAPSHNSSIS